MKRSWIYVLVGLAAVFFITSLIVFLRSGRDSAKGRSEVVNRMVEGKGEVSEMLRVKLFFYSPQGQAMVPVWWEIEIPATKEELYRKFLDTLLKVDSGLIRPVPEEVKIRALYFLEKQGVLVLDFSENLVASFPGGTAAELEFIFFIVDNLCYNFKEITKVKFLLGGNEPKTIAGHIDLEHPFYPDYSFVKDE